MNILIIKPSSLGDIIHTFPAVRILKRHFPSAKITWIVFERFRQLVELCDDADEILVLRRENWLSPSGLRDLYRFFLNLRRCPFDYVFDFQGLLRSGICALLSRSENKVGFAHARECATLFYSRKVNVPESASHAIDRNIYLINSTLDSSYQYITPQFRSSSSVFQQASDLLRDHNLSGAEYLVAVAPAARWPSKMWPGFFL